MYVEKKSFDNGDKVCMDNIMKAMAKMTKFIFILTDVN